MATTTPPTPPPAVAIVPTTTPAPDPTPTPATDPTTDPAPTPIKPGIYTSEGWITFIIVALGGLLSSGLVVDVSPLGKVIVFAVAALKAGMYTTARTQLKRAALPTVRLVVPASSRAIASSAATAATLLAGVFLISQMAACASAPVHAMTGAFSTCATADLGQIVNTAGQSLAQDVAAIIEGNAATLEQDLTTLAVKVGLDAVECAIAAVEAVLTATAATTTTATTATPGYPGLARAKTWLAAQRQAQSKTQVKKASR